MPMSCKSKFKQEAHDDSFKSFYRLYGNLKIVVINMNLSTLFVGNIYII